MQPVYVIIFILYSFRANAMIDISLFKIVNFNLSRFNFIKVGHFWTY